MKSLRIFSRHFPIIGLEGQKRLSRSKVAIVGAGALGSWEAYFLHKLGVGEIVVIDRDFVDESDIPRTIYSTEHIGRPKVEVLSEVLDVKGVFEDLNPSTAEVLDNVDLVIDGTDNVYTRQVINDYCVKNEKPWIYVGILSTYGNIMPIIPGKTACYRCLFPELPSRPLPTCAIAGIMSYVPPLAASIAVSLATKILLDEDVDNAIIYFDAKTLEFEKIKVLHREDCPACIKRSFIFLEKRTRIERMCDGAYYIVPPERVEIDLEEFANKLKSLGVTPHRSPQFLRFSDGHYEISIFRSGRMVIKGVKDEKEAKNVYARYVGV